MRAMLCLSLLAAGCSAASSPTAEIRSPARAAADANAAPPGWKLVAPTDAGFSVLLPEAAREETSSIEGTTVHVWLAKDRGVAYLVSYFELPAAAKGEAPDAVLHEQASGFFAGCRGRLEREQPIGDARVAAMRAAGSCQRGEPAIGTIFVQRSRVYQAFMKAEQDATADQATVERFLNSFKLVTRR